MIIPYQELSPDALNNLIEQFVLREGTEYGEHDIDLSEKVAAVLRQLKQGEAVIVYSELHENVDIVPKQSLHLTN